MNGQEPWAHSHVLYDQETMICNAIMLSCPKHPFWKAVLNELFERYKAGIRTVRATGPRMLTDVVAAWRNTTRLQTFESKEAMIAAQQAPLTIAAPEVFYPHFDQGNTQVQSICMAGELLDFTFQRCTASLERIRTLHLHSTSTLWHCVCYMHVTALSSGTWKDPHCKTHCTRPLSAKQRSTCDVLKAAGFTNTPPGPSSYATHHWAHTWLGKNL
eukprot:SAG31_NODE_1586_length_7821_cov_3.086765_1_plen_215_part_00